MIWIVLVIVVISRGTCRSYLIHFASSSYCNDPIVFRNGLLAIVADIYKGFKMSRLFTQKILERTEGNVEIVGNVMPSEFKMLLLREMQVPWSSRCSCWQLVITFSNKLEQGSWLVEMWSDS